MFSSIVLGWFLTFGYVPLQYDDLGYQDFTVQASDLATVADVGFSAKMYQFTGVTYIYSDKSKDWLIFMYIYIQTCIENAIFCTYISKRV